MVYYNFQALGEYSSSKADDRLVIKSCNFVDQPLSFDRIYPMTLKSDVLAFSDKNWPIFVGC